MMPSLAAGVMKAVARGDDAQRATIQALEARIAELETALGLKAAALYPRPLSPMQRAMFGILLARASPTKEQLMMAIYAGRPAADMPGDPDTVFKVQMHYLRRRVAPDGIEIETHGDRKGFDVTRFRLSPASKAKARAVMQEGGTA